MFKGIITPLLIPFHNDEKQSINYQETEKLIDHLLNHHVHGLFLLGSNGEFHVLSKEEKIQFTKHVVDYVNHRVPVFVGCGTCSTNETIELIQEVEKIGADAISLLPPYFIKPTSQELLAYFKEVAGATKLPIMLYNIPKNVGYDIDMELYDQALTIENIIGIKDSSGKEESIQNYIAISKKHNKQFFIGSDSKIKLAMELGADGAVAGTSNLITEHILNLYNGIGKLEEDKLQQLQKDVDVLRACLKYGTVPSVIKKVVTLAGIADMGDARKPVQALANTYNTQLEEMLLFYGLKQ